VPQAGAGTYRLRVGMPPPAVAGAQALEHPADYAGSGSRHRIQQTGMAAQEDKAIIAGQLADLTRTVEQMADQRFPDPPPERVQGPPSRFA
jgi:hypothetical protein